MTKRYCCCSLFSCFSGDNSQSSSNSAQPPTNNNAPAPALVREEATMTKRCCSCSLFSCFSGDNSQSSSNSAQPPADNNAPAPALVREEAPDLRQQDPQTNLPASTVLDVSPSSNSAPTQSEQPLPHEAPASGDPSSSTSTVPQLTKKIEVHVADGAENDSINLEGIIQDISELLEIIKRKSSDKKPSTDHYWPSTSFFSKLKEILSEGADAALALLTVGDVLVGEVLVDKQQMERDPHEVPHASQDSSRIVTLLGETLHPSLFYG